MYKIIVLLLLLNPYLCHAKSCGGGYIDEGVIVINKRAYKRYLKSIHVKVSLYKNKLFIAPSKDKNDYKIYPSNNGKVYLIILSNRVHISINKRQYFILYWNKKFNRLEVEIRDSK